MRFTREAIYRVLNLEQPALTHEDYHDNSGPGYLDFWLLLARNKNIWQHSRTTSQPARKQIIVSEPLEGRGPVSLFELQFFAALLEHFDVYFWPDNDQPFRNARPISNVVEFWENKRLQPMVARQTIIDSLIREGLSLDNILIIDFETYRRIREHSINRYIASSTRNYMLRNRRSCLDLSHVKPEQYLQLADCVDPLSIKLISIRPVSTEALHTLLRLFPNLRNLKIGYANGTWFQDKIACLEDINVTLSNFMPGETFVLPATTRLKYLSINVHSGIILRQFIAAPGAQVNSLILGNLHNTVLKLGELQGTRHLFLKRGSWRFQENNRACLDFISPDTTRNPVILPPGLETLELVNVNCVNVALQLDYYLVRNPSLRNVNCSFLSPRSLTIHLGKTSTEADSGCLSLGGRTPDPLEYLAWFSLNVTGTWSQVEFDIDLTNATRLEWLYLPGSDIGTSIVRVPPQVEAKVAYTYPDNSYKRHETWGIDGYEYLLNTDMYNLFHLYCELDLLQSFPLQASCSLGNIDNVTLAKVVFPGNETDFVCAFTGPKTRFIRCVDLQRDVTTGRVTLDFSACPQLESLVIQDPCFNLVLNLAGLSFLRFLDVQTSHDLQINHDQQTLASLEHLRVKAANAGMLRDILAYGVSPACITHFFTPAPQSFNQPVPPQPIQSVDKRLIWLYWSLAIALTAGGGVGVFFLLRYFFYSDDSPVSDITTLPSSQTTTSTTRTVTTTHSSSTATTTPEQGGVTIEHALSVWHIVLMTTGAGLLSGLLMLLYCMRNRLACSGATQSDPVPRFVDQGYQVDTNTGVAEHDYPDYPISYHVYPEDGQRPEHARLYVKNTVTFERGQLLFSTSSQDMQLLYPRRQALQHDNALLQNLMQRVVQDQNSLVHFEGPVTAGVFYPLPGWYPIECEDDFIGLYATEADLDRITCYYHPPTQHVFLTFQQSATIRLFYEVRKKPFYLEHGNNRGALCVQDPRRLLSPVIMERINQELGNHRELAFLFDNRLSLENKVQELTTYFRRFRLKPLERESRCQLTNMLNQIKERKGVCRHRSKGFMLLMQFLGCPVGIVGNVKHMFCFLPWQQDASGWRSQRLDLSLITPTVWENTIFRQVERDIRTDAKIALETIQIEAEPRYTSYYNDFRQRIAVKTLDSLDPLFDIPHAASPLICLNGLSAFAFNAGLIRYLASRGQDTRSQHLFIDSPQAFVTYLKPYRIKNGQMTEKRNGPLRRLLQAANQPAVLLIDWSSFSSAQMAGYQTLMDTPRMLFIEDEHFYLPDNVLVLGMVQDKRLAGEAFLSRTQAWTIGASFARKLESTTDPVALSRKKPVTAHVFAGSAWREALLGSFTLSTQGVTLEEGALLRAIRQQRRLIVYGPPRDTAFDLLVHQINDEKKYLSHATGRMEAVPPSVCIQTQAADHSLIRNTCLHVHTHCNESLQDRRPIYLGLHNLHELYQGVRVDEQGHVHSQPGGLLASYQDGRDMFYLVGDIVKARWDALLAHCNEHYPNQSFDFLLLPGSRIEGYQETAPEPVSVLSPLDMDWNKTIVVSSDPDYYTQRLAAVLSDPWVIYTNERSRFQELIATHYKDESSVNRFVYRQNMVLDALLSGRTLILSGALSLELYLQLMSLCSRKPHLVSNGQRLEVPGRLFLVMPDTPEQDKPFIQGRATYSLFVYHKVFPRASRESLQRIMAFYEDARRLPHSGRGRPQQFRINHARLTAFLSALEVGGVWHKHHPIKGLFAYDYPRRSEEQAYLNALGKYHLKPDDDSPVKASRLHGLAIHTLTDLRRHLWAVINCFYGAQLQSILGVHLQNVVYESGMPGLNTGALSRLFQLCQNQPVSHQQSARRRIEKSLEQIAWFRQDPGQNILMLKGPPGVGKTHAVRALIPHYHEGESAILAWLSDPADGAVYLSDEANMLLPGTLDALIKGVCNGQKHIVYQGKVFQVNGQHKKMILTGNHESFPGRYYHPAIQDYANTVYFEKPDDAFLEQHARERLLPEWHAFVPILLFAWHTISRYNPHLPTSIRDMGSLARRFACLCRQLDNSEPGLVKQVLLRACVSEFACSIKEEARRSAFISDLEEAIGQRYQLSWWGNTPLIHLTPDLAITQEKAFLLDTLLINLHMRLEEMVAGAVSKEGKGKGKRTSPGFFSAQGSGERKQYVILQGEPGVGKSRFLRALVTFYLETLKVKQARGLEALLIEQELQKTIHIISGNSSNASKVLTQAQEEEAFVILDEANIDPSLEGFLLQLLSKEGKPGLMILGSENDGGQEGRLERSPAELNRSQFCYFPPWKRTEYLRFASAAGIDSPEAFVNAFLDVSRENKGVGARHFFSCLKAEKTRSPVTYPVDLDSGDDERRPLLSAAP